jgi:hypothetical protein
VNKEPNTFTNSNITRSGPMASQPKGPREENKDISFKGKPQTFSNKNKNKKLDEDFPELG